MPILLAITLHEAAHGYVARLFGDDTAHQLGRITLNPLKHIDPIGTVLVPLIFSLLPGGLLFGWAKPVPVTFSNLRSPKRDMRWVAAAGPAANILMMFGWALLYKMGVAIDGSPYAEPLREMARMGVNFNLSLAALNLLPLPPLDGGRIAVSLLKAPWDHYLARVERYGFLILLGLLAAGLLPMIVTPLYRLIGSLLKLFL